MNQPEKQEKDLGDTNTFEQYASMLGQNPTSLFQHYKNDKFALYKECVKRGKIPNTFKIDVKGSPSLIFKNEAKQEAEDFSKLSPVPVKKPRNPVIKKDELDIKSLCPLDNTATLEKLKNAVLNVESTRACSRY